MSYAKFHKLKNPNAQQCLEYLHIEIKYPFLTNMILENRLSHIPKEHRTFCEAQLKLEGLL